MLLTSFDCELFCRHLLYCFDLELLTVVKNLFCLYLYKVIFGNFLIRKATVWKPDLVYLTKVLSLTCSFMVLCFVSLFMMSFVPWRNERNDRSRVQSDHCSFGSGWDGVSKIQSWRCSSSATAFWILNVRNHVRMISCSFKAPPL